MKFRGRVCSIMFLFVLAFALSGCTSISRSAPAHKGDLIRTDHVVVLPLFCTTTEVYSMGVQKNGNVLLFVNWSVWQDKPQPCAQVAEETPSQPPSEAVTD